MVINYLEKRKSNIKMGKIDADVIEYIIKDKEDLFRMAKDPNIDEYKPEYYFMVKDNSNLYEMVVDNIPDNRVVIGGIKDKDVIVQQYIVKAGLNELLMAIQNNNLLY